MKALIDRRVDKMAAEGLLTEVRALLDRGLPKNATAMQAIGYKEFLGCAGRYADRAGGAGAGKAPLPANMQSGSLPGCAAIKTFIGSNGESSGILPAHYRFQQKFWLPLV